MKPPMNTEQPSRNQTKVLHVFFACFAPFGESPAQDSPRSRQEREDFAKKNPFVPAKDFRVSSTEQPSRNSGDLCSSVFICGFVYDSIRRVISGFLPALRLPIVRGDGRSGQFPFFPDVRESGWLSAALHVADPPAAQPRCRNPYPRFRQRPCGETRFHPPPPGSPCRSF